MVRADPEQLYRVLSNLVRNARQAIEAAGQDGEGLRLRLRRETESESWWLRVSDTGPGLPPKAQEHLFTPFQGGVSKGGIGTGAGDRGGTGQGARGCA